jgi:hypothetical protein
MASMPTKVPRNVPKGRGLASHRLLSVNTKQNHARSVIPRANKVTSKNATTLSDATHLLRRRDLATPSTAPTTRAGNNAGTKIERDITTSGTIYNQESTPRSRKACSTVNRKKGCARAYPPTEPNRPNRPTSDEAITVILPVEVSSALR